MKGFEAMEYKKGYRFKNFDDLEKFYLKTDGIVRIDGVPGRFVVRHELLNENDSWIPTDDQKTLPPEISIYTLYSLKAVRYGLDPIAYIWQCELSDEVLKDLNLFEIRTGAIEINLEDLEVTGKIAPF